MSSIENRLDEGGAAGESLLRQIPSVDELLGREALRALEARLGRRLVVDSTRKVLQSLRARISDGTLAKVSVEMLEKEIVAATEKTAELSLRPVINATGVILHTNLGRAPLAAEAVEHLVRAATRYSNLEYDLARGERGKRDAHTDHLFAQLLGAEMTLVVNNNAAAVFLALNTLAAEGEVIVSRGELIEIGDGFRIPEVLARSGARLVEVGTTNRTRLEDYERAIGERTAVLLRVHQSNFRVVGFTERPNVADLVGLAEDRGVLLVDDLGHEGSRFELGLGRPGFQDLRAPLEEVIPQVHDQELGRERLARVPRGARSLTGPVSPASITCTANSARSRACARIVRCSSCVRRDRWCSASCVGRARPRARTPRRAVGGRGPPGLPAHRTRERLRSPDQGARRRRRVNRAGLPTATEPPVPPVAVGFVAVRLVEVR